MRIIFEADDESYVGMFCTKVSLNFVSGRSVTPSNSVDWIIAWYTKRTQRPPLSTVLGTKIISPLEANTSIIAPFLSDVGSENQPFP